MATINAAATTSAFIRPAVPRSVGLSASPVLGKIHYSFSEFILIYFTCGYEIFRSNRSSLLRQLDGIVL
jgi:hypothetical protein